MDKERSKDRKITEEQWVGRHHREGSWTWELT